MYIFPFLLLLYIFCYKVYDNDMKFYYGSKTFLKTPAYGQGNPSNDYGLGLYLTPDFEMAKLWASQFDQGGYAITYDVDLDNLASLSLQEGGEEAILRWITLLVAHRLNPLDRARFKEQIDLLKQRYWVDLTEVDVVYGYRADDAYFRYARDFLDNRISVELLSEAMRLGKLGKQVVLKSKKAFDRVRFVCCERVDPSPDYARFRSLAADQYHALQSTDSISNTFLRDILRRER